jgi:uncharacterized tellurite resistance protein B-like protein
VWEIDISKNCGSSMISIFKKITNPENGFNFKQDDPVLRIRVATCAILMAVAGADQFTDEERSRIIEILRDEFSLTREDAEGLMAVAGKEVDKSIDYWGFANTLNQSLSDAERIKIMENIWRVIYTDGQLSGHEDLMVHKFSLLLNLTHEQMIAAKLKIRTEKGLD